MKKSVTISDDGFLKSARDHFALKKIQFDRELRFFLENDQRMRLVDLRTHLGSKGIF